MNILNFQNISVITHRCLKLLISCWCLNWSNNSITSNQLMDIFFITECTDEQFKCHASKFCIDKSQVCNGIINCHDKSDEKNCSMLLKLYIMYLQLKNQLGIRDLKYIIMLHVYSA